ncbi:MAG TPA: FtsQ-type POTRA domain-containing protein [Patescibacteria group bacterium]|nr:FtsQ-type POTRA domain-containing protein [Patescibacteria group bacterium]
MSDDLPVRGGRVRQRGGPRRASRGFSPRRALAALALLTTAGLIWGAVASPAFAVRNVEVEGAVLTGDDAVRAALDLPTPAPNAFTLATDELRERLLALPAVADAEVSVGLPGTLRVRIIEREAVLGWRGQGMLLLADRDGRILGDATGGGAAAAAAEGLPLVADRRSGDALPAVGGQLGALDLDVATRLLSLVPADVGSAAPALIVGVDDRDGWTLLPTAADPWTAVFGFYGPEIRRPAMIPEQVRLLRSLLVGREARLRRVVLAGPNQGTYTLKPLP